MMVIVGGVKMEKSEALAVCKKNMHRYVMAQTNDGMVYDGIVESVDEENLYLAVPTGEAEMTAPVANNPHHNYGDHAYRAYGVVGAQGYGGYGGYGAPVYGGYGGYGAPIYGGYPGYGYGYPGYGPRRRFRRFILPLAALAALSLLPYY